jgi:hypothetical protein
MRRAVVKSTLVLGGMFLVAGTAEAQRSEEPSGFVGVSFVAADPVGDFGLLVDQGFGLELAGGAPMTENGHLRIRGDLGVIVYGHERLNYCGFTCRTGSDLTTTNSIVFGGIGPEFVFTTGNIEPYVHASAGLSYFVTSSSLDDNDGYGSYLETTNYSDVVFGVKYGGGVRFRVGGHRRPVYLDFGVERHDNGIANFLTEGDIVDHADGSVTIFPNRSEADLMTFRFGVSIGLRR